MAAIVVLYSYFFLIAAHVGCIQSMLLFNCYSYLRTYIPVVVSLSLQLSRICCCCCCCTVYGTAVSTRVLYVWTVSSRARLPLCIFVYYSTVPFHSSLGSFLLLIYGMATIQMAFVLVNAIKSFFNIIIGPFWKKALLKENLYRQIRTMHHKQ